MGEMIWVEVLSRHRDVTARHRCDGAEIHIGRGYDNDVVLDDPFVAPKHLRIVRDSDGKLIAEDLGSVNGLVLDGEKVKRERIILDGHRPVLVGHTLLRVRTADFPIQTERRVAEPHPFWMLGFAALTLLLGLEMLESWLGATTDARMSKYVIPLLVLAGSVLAWATLWAVLTRIFSGFAQYDRNLFIAAVGLLGISLANIFAEYVAFAFSWPSFSSYSFVAAWLIFGVVTYLQLRQLGPAHPRIKMGVVMALVCIGIALPMIGRWETQARFGQLANSPNLKPPSIRLIGPQDPDAFFQDVDLLKEKLMEDRKEPPKTGGIFSAFDGDD